MLLLIAGALIAGALTTLAPCVLPMLPVIVGGSVPAPRTRVPQPSDGRAGAPGHTSSSATPGEHQGRSVNLTRPLLVTASLGLSIIAFTLILKVSTALIGIPAQFWQFLSGGLLIALGLLSVFPEIWESFSTRLSLQERSTRRLSAARTRPGAVGAILTGAALGPVFTSCSPMYGYVVVTVMPANLVKGTVLLVAYALGLCATLLAVSLAGQRLLRRARWAADPHSGFRRILGAVFIAVGLLIVSGGDKALQTWIVTHSPIAPWELDQGFIPTP